MIIRFMKSLNFTSYEELCETLARGNEINFKFRGRTYFLFARFQEDRVVGYWVGAVDGDESAVDAETLCDFMLDGCRFGDVFDEIEVTDRTI